jgi:hypothetical protein
MPSFKLTSLALAAVSPIVLTSTQDQGCTPAGSYQCSLMVYADMMYFPSGSASGLSGNRYSDVTDGNCNSILVSGDLEPQSHGFKGSLQTSYGTTVQVSADWVSSIIISSSAVRFGWC